MTTLDPAYCADGCGRLAETERPVTGELVCWSCSGSLDESPYTWSDGTPVDPAELAAQVEHATPLEDR